MPQEDDLVAVGGDLRPETLLAAYAAGIFPMGLGGEGSPPLGWFMPITRGVLLPGDLHVSRSLRRARKRFTVTRDQDFPAVVRGCGDPSRDGAWITPSFAAAYTRLHHLGHAHSIEVRDAQSGEIAGGLYGVQIGGLFAGEAMFHRATDASKVAVWAMVETVFADGDPRRLIDVQWATPHLRSLGVRELSRSDYQRRLVAATALPAPAWV